MLDLGADQLEVVTDGRSVQTAAGGVQAQYQRRRACQHGEIGRVAAVGQHQDALQRRADCGQNGQTVRGGGLDQPPDAADKRLPVGGAGCQQQHKHDRRVDHSIAQRGRAHRQHRQHDHDRSGHARHKTGHRGLCQLFGQLSAHRRGILGALILTAVGHGDLRRFKRRDRIVLALILGTAGKAGGSLPDLGGGRDMGVGAGSRSVLGQRGRQPGGGIFIAQGVPCRLTAVDGIGNVTDKGSGVRLRRGGTEVLRVAAVGRLCRGRRTAQLLGKARAGRCRSNAAEILGKAAVRRCRGAQALGKAGMGRGSRRLRRQADAAGQSIDQLIHIIALAVGQQQFSGLAVLLLRGIPDNNGVFVRVLPGSVRRGRRTLRGGPGRGARLGCSLSALGAHGVVGAHELLRAVRRDSVQTADLHRKAAWDRLAAGHLDRLTHRLSAALRHRLRRRSGLGLFAGGELDRIALFAVDRAGHAAGQRVGRVLLGLIDRAADKVHCLAALLLRTTAGRAGVFAAPDLLRWVLAVGLRLSRAYRLGGRGGAGRLLRPLLGDHQLLGFLLRGKKTAQKALFSARLCAALGRLLRLLIGIILLLHGRVILILRIFAAERDIDGHKRPRILGMFEAEKAALFLFGLRHPALFIGHDRD